MSKSSSGLRDRFVVNGALTDEGNVLISKKSRNQQHPCFTIDGPFHVELDDLDEQVTAAVLDARWLTQISLPAAASGADLKLALQLAKSIAETCHGAVYDPQVDQVVWPRKSYRRFIAPKQQERIRLIGLDWYLPMSRSSSDTAKLLLRVLRKTCPEAVPTRFGTFEPLQHRLGSDDESFVNVWKEVGSVTYGDMFFWKSKSPSYGGSASFPDQRDRFRPAGVERAICLSVDFDGRALDTNPAWCETVVNLFLEVARQLRAFYGHGYVQRNVIGGRSVWFDQQSEGAPTVRGRWWLGLPPWPTWLAWFGGGYGRLLKSSMADPAIHFPEGIFLRCGDTPLAIDELTSVYPQLRQFLYPQFDGNNFVAAQMIPELE